MSPRENIRILLGGPNLNLKQGKNWDIKKKVSFCATPILDTPSVPFDANLVEVVSRSHKCNLFN